MPTYERADEDVVELVNELIERYHGDLHREDVRVDVLMAAAKRDKNGKPKGPALKLGGYPCLGTIKITSLQQRVLGMGDAVMTLDGDRWPNLAQPQREALIDHELTHLALPDGDEADPTDDYGRPKLKIRIHDHQFGWFNGVVRRHGVQSFEYR